MNLEQFFKSHENDYFSGDPGAAEGPRVPERLEEGASAGMVWSESDTQSYAQEMGGMKVLGDSEVNDEDLLRFKDFPQ